eukprot:Gb_21773 [translate_table: standard]
MQGVMMTHGNVVATVAAVTTILPRLCNEDIYLAYLPLAHIFELAAEATMIAAGCAIGYGSPLTLTDTSNKIEKGTQGDASMLGPTLMTAVPAILDLFRDGVRKKVEAKGEISKKLFDISYRRRLAAIEGSWHGAWGLEKLLWDELVFKKIRAILGGHVRGLLSGGAPLSGDTQRQNISKVDIGRHSFNTTIDLIKASLRHMCHKPDLISTEKHKVFFMIILYLSLCLQLYQIAGDCPLESSVLNMPTGHQFHFPAPYQDTVD